MHSISFESSTKGREGGRAVFRCESEWAGSGLGHSRDWAEDLVRRVPFSVLFAPGASEQESVLGGRGQLY